MSYSREAQIAWAAGLFEGEGSASTTFTGSKTTAPVMYLTIKMTDRDILERFRDIVGCGTVTGPRLRGATNKPIYCWQVAAWGKVQSVVDLLLPWMGNRRTEQLLRCIERRESAPRGPIGRPPKLREAA